MTAYYNEIDRFCCDWLSNLMDANMITPGRIDDRSIVDVRPDDLAGFERVHFFAGLGGWDHALNIAGWSGPVWTGSCPCQPFSLAGKRIGFDDKRDLWPAWFDVIRECSPPVIFGEQIAGASLWIDRLYADLEGEDFAIGSADLPAASVGAKHSRPRFWFVANSQRHQQPWQEPCGRTAGRVGREQQSVSWDEPWQSALSSFRALGDGLPRSVGATDAARNAIVPQVAANFIGANMTAFTPADGRWQMRSEVDAQLERAMLEVNALSRIAKAQGDLPSMYAASRAWHQLHDASADLKKRRETLASHEGIKP